MRKGQGPAAVVVRVDRASSASAFRKLDDAFLQTQTKIWLGEVLNLRFDEDLSVADLLADGELLFQVSKVIWKKLLKKNKEQLKQSKVYIHERLSFGKSNGKYMPYTKVDYFLKICQILGLAGIDLFTPSDVVEKRNVRKVCICIRSVSKRSHTMHLTVPDFDVVTYTISMSNYIVGGIRQSLEQPQYSSSSSSGYSPRANFKIIGGQNDQNGDNHYDSDEVESRLSVPVPEDIVDEKKLTDVLSQFSDAPKEGNGESRLDTSEEKSLTESVGSLNSDSDDSTHLLHHNKESCCSTQSATDRCSRTRTTECSSTSEESDSISSRLAFDSDKNDLELEDPPAAISETTHDRHVKTIDHSVPRNVEIFAGSQNNGIVDLQKDTGILDRHCDALACDRESMCSSCKEHRYGVNGELLEWRSGLTPGQDTYSKLLRVSEDPTNSTESRMDNTICVTGTVNDRISQELKLEFSTQDDVGDKSVHKSEDTDAASSIISSHKAEDAASKPGKGVLKSVAGGISLFGAVFFIVHLRCEPDFEVKFVDRQKGNEIAPHFYRRSNERSFFTSFTPSLSEKPVRREDSRAKNMDKGKSGAVYPGEWFKF